MRKIILTLGLMGSIYANNSLSCENMSEEEFYQKLLEYKKSINMNRFKNPENINDINREEMSQYSKHISYKGKTLKQCRLILDIRKYTVNDGRRYKALLSLDYNFLTIAEKRLYDKILEESKLYFSNYSKASVVSKDIISYPLVYLTMSKSNIYEFREINHKIKRYKVVTDMVNIPFKVGDMQTKQAFISYLNHNHNSNFILPKVKNNINKLQDKLRRNSQKLSSLPSNISRFKVLKKDLKNINSFKKYNGKVIKTTILKGDRIKYLGNRKDSSDFIILYGNKEWIISEKQWNDSIGGF